MTHNLNLIKGLCREIIRIDRDREEQEEEMRNLMMILQHERDELVEAGVENDAYLEIIADLEQQLAEQEFPLLSVNGTQDKKELQKHLGSVIKIFNNNNIDLDFIARNNEKVQLVNIPNPRTTNASEKTLLRLGGLNV